MSITTGTRPTDWVRQVPFVVVSRARGRRGRSRTVALALLHRAASSWSAYPQAPKKGDAVEFIGYCEVCGDWFRCGTTDSPAPQLSCVRCGALPRRLTHLNGEPVVDLVEESVEISASRQRFTA